MDEFQKIASNGKLLTNEEVKQKLNNNLAKQKQFYILKQSYI